MCRTWRTAGVEETRGECSQLIFRPGPKNAPPVITAFLFVHCCDIIPYLEPSINLVPKYMGNT